MSQSKMKLAAASSLPVSPEDDATWYGGGVKAPRRSGPAPRGSTGRSAPPPPPAAAFAHHARGHSGRAPRTHEPAFQLPVVPLPSSVTSDWSELSSSHFGSSLRPAEKPGVNWSRVSAIGVSAAALVGGLYTAILMDNAHRAYASESRALAQIEALAASHPVVARLPPVQPPSALAAIGPISLERDRPGTGAETPSASKSAASSPRVVESAAARSSSSSAHAAESSAAQSSSSSAHAAESAAQSSASSAHAAESAAQSSSSSAQAGAQASDASESSEAAVSDDASATSERASKSKKSASRRRGRSGVAEDGAEGETESASAAAKPLTAASHENLPEKLTRQQVMVGLESVRAALAMCVVPAHGTTYANVTIANTGKVTYSQVEGAFAGTKQGSCMARVLRGATFPRFSSETFKVKYPFVF